MLGVVIYTALFLQAIGFLFRDELWLRTLVLAGTLCYILYYYLQPYEPLWDAMLASGILGLINLVQIVIIIRERTLLAMSSEEAGLFEAFGTLSPGQFRRLMRAARWKQTDSKLTLTAQDEAPGKLYYIVSGNLDLIKNGSKRELGPGAFIGEIALLTGATASATVEARPGTVYVEWEGRDVLRLMRRSQPFENAMIALFNADLARKVAAG